MGKALYRKYRSRSLDEVVGQEHVTSLLERAISDGRVAHAYLFTGPRGVGKTSIARIVAHQINQLDYTGENEHLDIIEIDAASNNGVDDIRDLREKAHIAPAVADKKIYIIDEVHMLSKAAFNALLKTLEEPPEHVVFILATTDVDKLPDTIVSRTQRYSFHRASLDNLMTNLRRIAGAESLTIDDAALRLIAEHSDGSYRDSVSLLDQLASYGKKRLDAQTVETVLGLAAQTQIAALAEAALSGHLDEAIASLEALERDGVQPGIVAEQLVSELRRRITAEPRALELIDSLLVVNQSHAPYAKLLTTVGLFTSADARLSATPSIPAPVPVQDTTSTSASANKPSKQPASKKTTQPADTSKATDAAPAKKTSGKKSQPTTFDWGDYQQGVTGDVGLTSILQKSTGILADNVLTIYTGKKFYKTKLDAAKCKKALSARLHALGYDNVEIEIESTTAPHADSQIADVAAIMGGGEAVEYNE